VPPPSYVAATRGVNLEKREKLCDETPRPLQLAVLLETRFINVTQTVND